MKIGIRGGHSPNCKGAMGILDEQDSVRALSYAVTPLLQQAGHVVIDCNSNAGDVNGELNEGTNMANNNGCDIYITLHMNAFNGNANGVEALVFDDTSQTANAIARRTCENLSGIGLFNRGIKQRQDLHDLTASNMQACLIEVLFCDSGKDVAIWNTYGLRKMSALIANAIDPNIRTDVSVSPVIPSPPQPQPKPSNPSKNPGKVDAIYQVFTDRWWPKVTNKDDWAGEQDGIAIKYVALRVTTGSVKYRVHTRRGWLGWITMYNINDLNSGCAGDGTPIDAIEIYYNTPDGYSYKRAVYRVSDLNNREYYVPQYDSEIGNGQDGYAGVLGVPVDKLQIWIE